MDIHPLKTVFPGAFGLMTTSAALEGLVLRHWQMRRHEDVLFTAGLAVAGAAIGLVAGGLPERLKHLPPFFAALELLACGLSMGAALDSSSLMLFFFPGLLAGCGLSMAGRWFLHNEENLASALGHFWFAGLAGAAGGALLAACGVLALLGLHGALMLAGCLHAAGGCAVLLAMARRPAGG